MGWLDNAIRRRMPVTLGVEQIREYFPSEAIVADEKRLVLAEDATSTRTAE